MMRIILFFWFYSFIVSANAQKGIALKPLYDDPVYHGAADPVVIYNKAKKKWWMLYSPLKGKEYL